MPEPSLQLVAAPCPLDIPLTVPNQRDHALDRAGRQERLAEHRGHLQPMHRQEFFERFPERLRRRLVLRSQSGIQLKHHPSGVGMADLLKGRHESSLGLAAVGVG